ncbi:MULTISPECIES: hypothetical protein [Enterococcus]|uniref:Uncharacterized protein n=1 Tax=Enterococcus casseliflavus TaxID=37734 RepID=A0ABD6Z1J0_ENTCA|nr:hypothetical protein [Enterococcus casseliflavus]AYJ46674.1 hypothetical protein D8N35_16850 [Enterococcus casseliflavus]EOH79256.1 hypothetical protein UAM_02780 [Enterococcus casseliflavus ATCC 49996]EOU08937.1 hypothetical protein I582_02101 [Enterococcus casseliflavus ATCC 49996]MDT2980405.1 hypothetical protein [Enterococcus casseliflavus]MEB6212803.1 hypothetical protein [Enterococcus casseliflavus]
MTAEKFLMANGFSTPCVCGGSGKLYFNCSKSWYIYLPSSSTIEDVVEAVYDMYKLRSFNQSTTKIAH